jgi:SAM-dependent methyltransferase
VKCHICDKTCTSFEDAKTGIHYYHCFICEYIFKSPEHYQSIEAQKSRYDLHENNEDDAGYRAYFQRFVGFVLPYVGKPKYALDFGCGRSTLLAKILKNIGIDTDVFDPIYHPETLDDGKKYDLIVSTEVFEHLHDPKSVFSDLVSRLNEGGHMAIQTQFHPNDREAFKSWYYHHDPTHIVFFAPRTFAVLCEQYGCSYIADNGRNMVVIRKQRN